MPTSILSLAKFWSTSLSANRAPSCSSINHANRQTPTWVELKRNCLPWEHPKINTLSSILISTIRIPMRVYLTKTPSKKFCWITHSKKEIQSRIEEVIQTEHCWNIKISNRNWNKQTPKESSLIISTNHDSMPPISTKIFHKGWTGMSSIKKTGFAGWWRRSRRVMPWANIFVSLNEIS